MNDFPTLQDIVQAHEDILPYIHYTPVLTSTALNLLSGSSLHFKCENFQKVGAFKARGAFNAALKLEKGQLHNGIATHSSGNHAQAIALAAKTLDTTAYIVMPKTSPKVKVNAVKGYGAEIIFCEPTLKAREETLNSILHKSGATFIHPYNDFLVICGQATCTKELVEQTTQLDYIFCPIGGGGLISGALLATKYFSPATKVIGCEPEGANDAYQSWKKGERVPSVQPNTIADGLLTSMGDKTWPIIKEYIEEIITVNDDEIIRAMRLIWERMKIIIEPSCAVPFAALLKSKERFLKKEIGVILTGGNVDLNNLPF